MSKPTLPSCGWLMLPTTFCGSVRVYSWESHMPAPRIVTLRMPCWLYCPRVGSGERIFCSCRHWPAGIQTQLITPFWSSVTARRLARRCCHLLQVDEVDDVERRCITRIPLQLELGAWRVGLRQQCVGLV